MKRIMIALISTSIVLNVVPAASFNPNGYCKKPVADLIGAPIANFFKDSNLTTEDLYKKLPYDTADNNASCPRICQLVYNDPVEILEYRGSEVHVRVPQWSYTSNGKKFAGYWAQATSIGILNKNNNQHHPNNLPYQTDDQHIIVLDEPFFCKKTKTHYSVGTRFVLDPHKKRRRKRVYTVFYEHNEYVTHLEIPTAIAHEEVLENPDTVRTHFLDLLQSWADHDNGYIPYAIGGCSFIKRLPDNVFFKQPCLSLKNDCFFRSTYLHPLTGFDCARLISRAAQVSGIPLFASNSTTIARTLKNLKPDEYPQNGDLIFINKHIAAISDIEKGLLIEARCYNHGYGIVHEIPFHEQFKNINTTDDLVHAYRTKQKVVRLDADGETIETLPRIILLKLC